MEFDFDERIYFGYENTEGQTLEMSVDGEYLPHILRDFATFLRAAGFSYVAIDLDAEGNIVFKKDHPMSERCEYCITDHAWQN